METLGEYPEKHLITTEERAVLESTLGSMGLVFADVNVGPFPVEREDERWPHGGVFRAED